MSEHTFIAQQTAYDAVTARCTCGWVGPYSHAYEKYAVEDHAFHVENEGER